MRAVTDAQLELAPSVEAVHRANGCRIRAALALAIEKNGMSRSDLAAEASLDGAEVTRILDPTSDRHIPPRLIAAVMAKDRARAFVCALAEMVGMEAKPRVADLAAENRQLKAKLAAMRAELDDLLGGAA